MLFTDSTSHLWCAKNIWKAATLCQSALACALYPPQCVCVLPIICDVSLKLLLISYYIKSHIFSTALEIPWELQSLFLVPQVAHSMHMCFPLQAGYTALIIATTNNNRNITSLLIAKGANVNLQDDVRRETCTCMCMHKESYNYWHNFICKGKCTCNLGY